LINITYRGVRVRKCNVGWELKHDEMRQVATGRRKQREKRARESGRDDYYSVTLKFGHPSSVFVTGIEDDDDSWLNDRPCPFASPFPPPKSGIVPFNSNAL
jgi:hypothetical protein